MPSRRLLSGALALRLRRLRPRDRVCLLRNSPLPDRFMHPGARAHDNSLRRATRSEARARGDGESHPARRFMLLARCRCGIPDIERIVSFQRATTPWSLPPTSDTPAATVPPDAQTRRLPGVNIARNPLHARLERGVLGPPDGGSTPCAATSRDPLPRTGERGAPTSADISPDPRGARSRSPRRP